MTSKTTTPPDPYSNGEAPPAAPYDPFDPASLRVSSGAPDAGVERGIAVVPIRKPKKHEYFRVRSDPAYMVDTQLLELEEGQDKVTYLVDPPFQHLVAESMRPVRLVTCVNKAEVVFLWAIKLPLDDSGVMQRISDSALICAEEAKSLWVKMSWVRELGAYEFFRARGDLGAPQWPDKSFRDLIELAFRHNRIDRANHPVIQRLDGEL